MSRKQRAAFFFAIAALAFPVLFGSVPVFLAFTDVFSKPSSWYDVLSSSLLWKRFGYSLFTGLLTLLVIIPIGFIQAWVFTRIRIPARTLWLVLLPIPFFLPPLVHVLTWFRWVPLRGTEAIVFISALCYSPLVTLLCMRALESIGRDEVDDLMLTGGTPLVFYRDIQQAFPSSLVGGFFALTFMLSDFAVADFITSVGPKITVYADTIYRYHLVADGAGVAIASLPGLLSCLAMLLFALRIRRALVPSLDANFASPLYLRTRSIHWLCLLLVAMTILPGALLPLWSLTHQVGSWMVFSEELRKASSHISFSLMIATCGATLMALVAIPIAHLRRRVKHRWIVAAIVVLPFTTPALLFGIGLIRSWNHPGLDIVYTSSAIVILAVAIRYLPFVYLPYSGALERLDGTYEESAKLEGAGSIRRFLSITMPLTLRPLVTAWCVVFCLSLRELDTLIMLRAGQQSLTFHLYSNIVFAREDQVAAIALILLLTTIAPMLIFAILTGRRPQVV